MKNGFIAVLDSGIGGLSVLKSLLEVLPNERYVYFGDNDNVPYGGLSPDNLLRLSMNNLLRLHINFPLKAIVVGCNTLSMTVIDKIRNYFDVPVFGVFPPVVMDRNKKTLLLATSKTSEEYKKYLSDTVVLPQPYLASQIEKNCFNLDAIDFNNFDFWSMGDFDSVILGCTHYFFVKNKILDHLKPPNILSGEKYTAIMVKKYLVKTNSLDNTYRNCVLFFGNNADKNKRVWKMVVKDT